VQTLTIVSDHKIGLIDDGSWRLPLLDDPEKNRVSICSACSRDIEEYLKIGKNLEDLENREDAEILKTLRETAEAEGIPNLNHP